jgi:hypothetical protein
LCHQVINASQTWSGLVAGAGSPCPRREGLIALARREDFPADTHDLVGQRDHGHMTMTSGFKAVKLSAKCGLVAFHVCIQRVRALDEQLA